MKLLKSNGFNISEILSNLSSYDEEEIEKDKKEDKDESESSLKDFSFKLGEQLNGKEDNNIYENINIKSNKADKDKDSDKLNIKKIVNMNKKNNKLKEHEEFSFRNNKKIISHSVGDDKD